MSHYEARLEEDLSRIVNNVKQLGQQVETALLHASQALLSSNKELASQVILGDLPINRDVRALDRLCHVFVARHLPSAGHLRFVSSVLRLNVGIERSGDYAATIAREAAQLPSPPPPKVAEHIERLSEQSRQMFHQALHAFCNEDAELARTAAQIRNEVDASFREAFTDLVSEEIASAQHPKDHVAHLTVLNSFSRVASQSKNVCEETIFRITGETKAPKVYRVLFIDAGDDGASRLATAYARKAFPHSGDYASAGWHPAAQIDPAFAKIASDQGLDLGADPPRALSNNLAELSDFHVIVSLVEDGRSHVPELPFRTTFLQWQLTNPTSDDGCRDLRHKIRELMEILRGEGAD